MATLKLGTQTLFGIFLLIFIVGILRTVSEISRQPGPWTVFTHTPYLPQKQYSNFQLDDDYLVNPDYSLFGEEPDCTLSEPKKQRIYSRVGPGKEFNPTKLELSSDLPFCNWSSFAGVMEGSTLQFDPYRLKFEPVNNIFRDEQVNFHLVVPVSHRKEYPLPKFASLDILHNIEDRKKACKLNIRSAIRWPMCCSSFWNQTEDGTYSYFPIGANQPCGERIFVASIPCGFVDWGSKNIQAPGTVFIPPQQMDSKGKIYLLQPANRLLDEKDVWNLQVHDRIATVLEVYGGEHGHFVPEVLPFVVVLVLTLPEDVPILIRRNPFVDKFLMFLVDKGLTSMERFIDSEKLVVHAAREVYKAQYWPPCTVDANYMPSPELAGLLRRMFAPEIPLEQRDLIVIVHRQDAKMRVVLNHNEMMEKIKKDFPQEQVEVYVSKNYPLKDSLELFRRAKIVIGAHGAGLMINLQFCGQGTHIIEIGFDKTDYPIPSGTYALAGALDLEYWLTVGRGGLLDYALYANIDEIMIILHKILN